MPKKIQKSLQITLLAAAAMILGSPTFARESLTDIKKHCNTQFPNAAYHKCKADRKCAATDKACKASCNTLPAVQVTDKKYDACVAKKSGIKK